MSRHDQKFKFVGTDFWRLMIIATLASLMAAGSVVIGWLLIKRSEREYESRASFQVTYETRLVEVFTQSLLKRFDDVLTLLCEGVLEGAPPADIVERSMRLGALSESLFQVAIISAGGELVATTGNTSSIGSNLSDRDYFRIHRESDADQMVIGRPRVGHISGRLSFKVSRPIRNASGQFLGVVVGAVDAQLLSKNLEVFGGSNNSVVNLLGRDGIIYAHTPFATGRQFTGSSIAEFVAEDDLLPEGSFRAVSRLDKVERIFAFRPLQDVSLAVLVSKEIDVEFADFYKQRRFMQTLMYARVAIIIGIAILLEMFLRAQERFRVSKALAAIHEQQSTELLGIMDGCGAALVQTDAAGQIVACNSVFAAIFGAGDRSTLLGRTFDSVVSGRSPIEAECLHFNRIRTAIAYPVRFEASFMLGNATGHRRDIMWSWTQTKTGVDSTIRFVGVGIDNTELRAKEMMVIQASKLASLGRLAATLNHEMVQPLNVLRLGLANLTTLIERNAPKEDLLARAGKAVDNIHRTGSILKRFRSLIRQDKNALEIIQLRDAIHAAVAMYEEQFRIDGIKIVFEPDFDCEMECNRIELEQVFVNLLANAYDAILESRSAGKVSPGLSLRPPDSVRVHMELVPGLPSIVSIAVEDSGGGIPAEIIVNVFQPFFTTRSETSGTGLGLAICRATVENLKGKIEVSNTGRGARFVVSLPIHTASATSLAGP